MALLNEKKLKTDAFISENIFFENAEEAYKKLSGSPDRYMAISLYYE